MPMDLTVFRGKIHGRRIDLESDAGFPDGQEVSVAVEPIYTSKGELAGGDGLQRAFGGWAEDGGELAEFLEWNRQQRKQTRPEIAP